MAVTKRTRFEVLKRDNHTCRYCGANATESPLTVDHVVPVALGGSDAPDNLVAACRDCNAGKSSSSPDASAVAQVADDAVRWARARKQAMQEIGQDHYQLRVRYTQARDYFASIWEEHRFTSMGFIADLPGDWEATIDRWVRDGVDFALVTDAVELAMANPKVTRWNKFAYLIGIMRNKLAEVDSRAQLIVREATPSAEVISYNEFVMRALSKVVDGVAA